MCSLLLKRRPRVRRPLPRRPRLPPQLPPSRPAVRAASALARGEDLASAKLGDAFYDQSHLIREIKRFAGATPGQLARPSRYTEATATGRKNLAGKVSPIVSDT